MPLYKQLLELVGGKEYFVITTNVDAQFEKAGFAKERIFAVQGDYREMQCQRACHPVVYSSLETVRQILAASHDLTIPKGMAPKCPKCGGNMEMRLRVDGNFIEDEAWHEAARNYGRFLRRFGGGKLLLLEMGVGFNTPTIIRYPFEEIAASNPDALLARINVETIAPSFPIEARLVNMSEPMEEIVGKLLAEKKEKA